MGDSGRRQSRATQELGAGHLNVKVASIKAQFMQIYYYILYYSNLILPTGHTHLTQNYQLGCPEGFLPEIKTISTPHNCQFWYNIALFRLLEIYQKVRKLVTS